MSRKQKKVIVSFKDPDFDSDLRTAGLNDELVKTLHNLAEFGEYWTLELSFNSDGTFSGKIVQT